MQPIDVLEQIILAEAPGAYVPDPTATIDNSVVTAQFTFRTETGEMALFYSIPKGKVELGARKAITRIEMRFQRETGREVYVKICIL